MIDRDARRLERAGVKVPRRADGSCAVALELSPLTLWDDADVEAYVRRHGLTELADNGKGICLE